MGRILSIDFGRKRTGLAATDSLKIVANGLATVPTAQVIDFIKKYMATDSGRVASPDERGAERKYKVPEAVPRPAT